MIAFFISHVLEKDEILTLGTCQNINHRNEQLGIGYLLYIKMLSYHTKMIRWGFKIFISFNPKK